MGEIGRHLGWRSPLDAARLLTLIRSSSAVLIGGGGLLQDVLPHFYRPFCVLALAAKALGRPVMFYSTGVYPPRTEAFQKMLRRAVSRANVVTVRDEFSAQALATAGVDRPVTIVADPAITLRPLPSPLVSRRDGRPLVGVSLRPWFHMEELETGDVRELARLAARCLDAVVAESGADLRFIPMHFGSADDDAHFQERVIRLMRSPAMIELSANQRPADTLREIAGCDVLLGMRLHANILAAAAGVPSIALVYDPKVREFMRQLGCEDRVLDIHTLQPSDVAAHVVALLADREKAALEMREHVAAMAASARECAATAAGLAGCRQTHPETDNLAMGA